jgi:hypothetical protein
LAVTPPLAGQDERLHTADLGFWKSEIFDERDLNVAIGLKRLVKSVFRSDPAIRSQLSNGSTKYVQASLIPPSDLQHGLDFHSPIYRRHHTGGPAMIYLQILRVVAFVAFAATGHWLAMYHHKDATLFQVLLAFSPMPFFVLANYLLYRASRLKV